MGAGKKMQIGKHRESKVKSNNKTLGAQFELLRI